MASKDADAPPEVCPQEGSIKSRGPPPTNALAKLGEKIFQVHSRGSSWLAEIRAGCVLFMTSAYILFLNPLILSGGSSAFNTGMPASDVVLATAVSTGLATCAMGLVGNYPWVVSVQLGTNSYFVNNVLQINTPCGHNAQMYGNDNTCVKIPCTCVPSSNGTIVPDVTLNGKCKPDTPNKCLGTRVPYQQALAATFLEGVVFLAICLVGARSYILRLFPKSVLMAGAAGIGIFIAFVGAKDSGFIVAAPYPTLLQLNVDNPYVHGGWGKPGYSSGCGFNDCKMYFDGPPYGPVCPWLAVGGLLFTGILMCWNINGATIMGIFFTMFVSWIIFPDRQGKGGLVPNEVVANPRFQQTAFALDFNWGANTGHLVGAFFTFLYLDFIGSSITFVSLGQMAGLVNEKGEIPRSNIAFLADGFGSMMGGLLGSSALTTYVESATAMREGGRTGFTAVICSLFFFMSVFLSPLFSSIPFIATGPVLCLIGVVIFMSAITEVDWSDLTEAIPAVTTILGMPFTHNIAYGVVGGLFMYVIIKAVTYQLFAFQRSWPGSSWYDKQVRSQDRGMFVPVQGWNVDPDGNRLEGEGMGRDKRDYSMLDLLHSYTKRSDSGVTV